jgi:PAT family beta-lactamase induction signal transducer AmpG
MSSSESKPAASPWSFVPTLYFPYGMLGFLSVWQIMQLFKLLGYSNTIVSLVSGLGFLGAFRFLYAPWLDGLAAKRKLCLGCMGLATFLYLVIGVLILAGLKPSTFLLAVFPFLIVLALVASSMEVAADGFYIRALDEKSQATFIGIRTAAIRLGSLFLSVGLGWVFAQVAASYGAVSADSPDKTGFYVANGWLYLSAAAITAGFLVWNWLKVPTLPADVPVESRGFALGDALKEYFSQEGVGKICAVVLLYRFGEGFLGGMMGQASMGPFYLDPLSEGGMGVPVASGPVMMGISGMPMIISGGVLGGFIIRWYGLRRTFVPMALAMSLPNIGSVLLAIFQPQAHFLLFGEKVFSWLLLAAVVENFTYGMSFSAISYYVTVMASQSGRNKTSILAISSALQYIGFFIPMMMSGAVQARIGYVGVFALAVVAGLPAVFVIPRLPLPRSEQPTIRTGD